MQSTINVPVALAVALTLLTGITESARAGTYGGQITIPDLDSAVDLGDAISYSGFVYGVSNVGFSDTWSRTFLISGGITIDAGGTVTTDPSGLTVSDSFSGISFATQAGVGVPVFEQIYDALNGEGGMYFAYPAQIGTITVYDNLGSNPNNPVKVLSPSDIESNKARYKACPGCTPVGNGGVRGDLGITGPGVAVTSFQPSSGVGNEIYIDPQFASRYEISVEAGGPDIASFVLPGQADPYSVAFNGTMENGILGGQVYQFPLGVTDFIVDGIDETTPFDGTDPAFTYGLTFYSDAADIRDTDTVVDMTAFLTPDADVPEPSSLILLASALAALGVVRCPRTGPGARAVRRRCYAAARVGILSILTASRFSAAHRS